MHLWWNKMFVFCILYISSFSFLNCCWPPTHFHKIFLQSTYMYYSVVDACLWTMATWLSDDIIVDRCISSQLESVNECRIQTKTKHMALFIFKPDAALSLSLTLLQRACALEIGCDYQNFLHFQSNLVSMLNTAALQLNKVLFNTASSYIKQYAVVVVLIINRSKCKRKVQVY